MALSLIYITNNPTIALIAEKYGVDRIMVDLETLGKEKRQKGMNTVKSMHTIADVKNISYVLTYSELLVRVNPWHENSIEEIESVIFAGADRIMLPMWKSENEVDSFLKTVNRRVKTILLLETKEAVECLDSVLDNPLIDEVHIGLNDLHLSYEMTFMFELLADGTVEKICNKCKQKGIRYGFGGIARIGTGMLPAEVIAGEHYRLGSSIVILARAFCNTTSDNFELDDIKEKFSTGVHELRKYEEFLKTANKDFFTDNQINAEMCIRNIVEQIRSIK